MKRRLLTTLSALSLLLFLALLLLWIRGYHSWDDLFHTGRAHIYMLQSVNGRLVIVLNRGEPTAPAHRGSQAPGNRSVQNPTFTPAQCHPPFALSRACMHARVVRGVCVRFAPRLHAAEVPRARMKPPRPPDDEHPGAGGGKGEGWGGCGRGGGKLLGPYMVPPAPPASAKH